MSTFPKTFHLSHDFSYCMLNIIGEIIELGEEHDWFAASIEMDNEHLQQMNGLEGEYLWEWLEQSIYKSYLPEIIFKMVFRAILKDFCDFISESLKCLEISKITVAFSLLRKPFKDDLLVLEWLLADSEEFLTVFSGESTGFAPDHISSEKKKEIIKKAIEKTSYPEMYDGEFLYDIRYNKSCQYGYEAWWNQAAHLVTTFKDFRTKNRNFNFVFSTPEDMIAQWDKIYSAIPYMLFYVAELSIALLEGFIHLKKNALELSRFRVQILYILWCRSQGGHTKEIESFVKYIKQNLKVQCPNCSTFVKWNQEEIYKYARNLRIKCRKCGTDMDLADSYYSEMSS